MRVLVTGAGGLLGSHIARGLGEVGAHVLAGVRTRTPERLLHRGIEVIPIELTGEYNFPQSVDAVVHAAALTKRPEYSFEQFVNTNALATSRLAAAAAAAGAKSFVYLSTISIYGEIKDKVVNEETPVRNPDFYGLSKYAGEISLRSFASTMRIVSLRIPGVLCQEADEPWLARLVNDLRHGRPVKVFNPNAPFNGALYADQLAAVIDAAVRGAGCGPYCIGAGEPMRFIDIVELLRTSLHSTSQLVIEPEAKGSFLISTALAERELGYVPATMQSLIERFASDQQAPN